MNERWIEWIEPFGPSNEPVYCRIPVSTAVAHSKWCAAKISKYTYPNDEEALVDFMLVHWAAFAPARNNPIKEQV